MAIDEIEHVLRGTVGHANRRGGTRGDKCVDVEARDHVEVEERRCARRTRFARRVVRQQELDRASTSRIDEDRENRLPEQEYDEQN